MPRTPIRAKTTDVITDDGSVLVSVAKGEQIHLSITLDWLSDLTGYTISAKVAEGANEAGDLEVTFANGKIETFPNSSYLEVVITDDIA